MIFARAEKIASCDSINNIWDLDVVEALRYLGERKAVIYLDALEYISRQLESQVTKLCSDYVSRSKVRDDEVDKCAFEIVKYYVDSFLKDGLSVHITRTLDYLTPRLEVIMKYSCD